MELQSAYLHRRFREAMREMEAPDEDLVTVDGRYLVPEVQALFLTYQQGFTAGMERSLIVLQQGNK